MRRLNKASISLFLIIVAYLIFSLTVLINKFNYTYTLIINPIIWFSIFLLCKFLFRNEYVNKKYRVDVMQIVLIISITYLILYYLVGLFIGFQHTPYSYKLIDIIKNLIAFGLVIFFQEYVREKLINRSKKNPSFLVLITILFIFIDLNEVIIGYDFSSSYKIFQFVSISLLPAIARNCLLSYLTYNADFVPSLTYKLITRTYFFIIPFIPNLNWFLNGVLDLVIPFIVFICVYNLFEKRNDYTVRHRRKYKGMWFYIPIGTVLATLVILVSGVIDYQLIAIASNSMNPLFYRGDAVLVEKNIDISKLKENDIIVFNSDGTLVVHRIVEKIETMDDVYIYKTKGDNNKSPDSKLVEKNNIIGEYKGTIKFIGLPSVLLQEVLR